MNQEIKHNGQKVCTGNDEINRKQDTYFNGRTWDKLSQEEKDRVYQQLADEQQKSKRYMDVDMEENIDDHKVIGVDFKK